MLDYVPPEFTLTNEMVDERLVRGALLGTMTPRVEGAEYSSVEFRSLMQHSLFRPYADIFGIEGGYSLADLRKTFFERFRPSLHPNLSLSYGATQARLPNYTFHNLQCYVDGNHVRVVNQGLGEIQGSPDTALRVPGLPVTATITVRPVDGMYTANWATRPSMSIGTIAANLETYANAPLNSLTSVDGPIPADVRQQLLDATKKHTIAAEKVVAAVLLLTNAVSARLSYELV